MIYKKALAALKADKADTFLVTCGGIYDAQVFREAGFENVTISNLAREGDEIGGFPVAHADAENLGFPDGSFDWGVVHAGLHHCASPHRGLLELLRVSRKGALVIEARDSALMRLAIRAGFAVDYELEAVALRDFAAGGLRDTAIPNYIYRWTEREIEKIVASLVPSRRPQVEYLYGLALPTQRLAMSGFAKRMLAKALGVAARVITFVAPRQGNQFAFIIRHGAPLQAWMADERGMRRDYALGFDPKKYWRNRPS